MLIPDNLYGDQYFLKISGLTVEFLHENSTRFLNKSGAPKKCLDNVSVIFPNSKRSALIGETGSGKSMLVRIALGLMGATRQEFPGIKDGKIVFKDGDGELVILGNGHAVTEFAACNGRRTMRKAQSNVVSHIRERITSAKLCPKRFSMVFQDAAGHVHPHLHIGTQLFDAQDAMSNANGVPGLGWFDKGTQFWFHKNSGRERAIVAQERLKNIQIQMTGKEAFSRFPSWMSGGEKQRFFLESVMGLEPNPPGIMVADEPFTDLDRANQETVEKILFEENGDGPNHVITISHDIGVVLRRCQCIYIMRKGRCVQWLDIERANDPEKMMDQETTRAAWEKVFENQPVPIHPYLHMIYKSRQCLCEVKTLGEPGWNEKNCFYSGQPCPRYNRKEDACNPSGQIQDLQSGTVEVNGIVVRVRGIHGCNNPITRKTSHLTLQTEDQTPQNRPDPMMIQMVTRPGNVDTEEEVILEASGITRVVSIDKNRRRRILDNVSLKIFSGWHVGLIGTSGSGKSTLAAILAGLDAPQKSEKSSVKFRLEDSWVDPFHPGLAYRKLRRNLQYIFQENYPGLERRHLVKENLLRYCRMAGVRNSDKAIAFFFNELRLPHAVLEKKVQYLSGGEVRMVSCIRTFLSMNLLDPSRRNEPKLVILDESTRGLDMYTQFRMLKFLRRMADEFNITYLNISHDLAVIANLSDLVITIYGDRNHGGRFYEAAATRDFFNSPRHPYSQFMIEGKLVKTSENQEEWCPFYITCPDPPCGGRIGYWRTSGGGHIHRCLR